MPSSTEIAPVSPGVFPPETAHLVAAWTEVLLYGIYTCLYIEAAYIMLKKRRENIVSANVFLVATFLMYIVSTAHIVLGLHRLLTAFVYRLEPPALYFMDFRRWETVAHSSMLCIMTWLGDMLVIYRCWIVWHYNFLVILLPLILLIFEFVVNIMLLVWFTHFGMASFDTVMSWMATIYPLVFAQNIITTGLIAFKIWTQHRISTASGVIDTSTRLSLINILRIFIESAAIYTFQIMVLLILYPMKHNAQFIVQSAVIPSIGIVFVLIAVRVHLVRSSTFNSTRAPQLPDWFGELGSSSSTPITTLESSSGSAPVNIEKCEVGLAPSASNLLHRV
ncbi:hypothetical protein AGABI2DRAFT_195264 [Agaricus bisporus var. bisporus H97]|uniref:hypothetical protein n=1 Tax=Agaricus bisporus var. bisporus (strain H97 / ATCC MYA-4626 / FGSC 10389) TaxID=936046 RepID=UPI00029F7141|nr:hypothetical protein AGABI2DRAFT_195264 [Agaricus bisporus var. bisporus H97]EKV42994.1 hypothetical protein AGABI2DRAFT_195264 [Agaricus bisporus var. bisporus H97]